MKLACLIFGHIAPPNAYNGVPYAQGIASRGAPDNIGRIHAEMDAQCYRCDEYYQIAKFHVNDPRIIKMLVGHSDLKDLEKMVADKKTIIAKAKAVEDRLTKNVKTKKVV